MTNSAVADSLHLQHQPLSKKGATNVNNVKGSNFVDLGVVAEGRTAIVFAAVDNLVKGGAGQGVQCLNVMFGLPEDAGLSAPPAQP